MSTKNPKVIGTKLAYKDNQVSSDELMQKHLENNILGDSFDESTMIRVSESHMDLVTTEDVTRYPHDFMKLINAK